VILILLNLCKIIGAIALLFNSLILIFLSFKANKFKNYLVTLELKIKKLEVDNLGLGQWLITKLISLLASSTMFRFSKFLKK
jgi:hypothetical protein